MEDSLPVMIKDIETTDLTDYVAWHNHNQKDFNHEGHEGFVVAVQLTAKTQRTQRKNLKKEIRSTKSETNSNDQISKKRNHRLHR